MDYQDLSPVQLARLCAEADSEAWREFIRRHQRPIALVILRILRRSGGASALLIDDLVQETYARLCANGYRLLRDFIEEHPSSLVAMVRVIAAHVTHDHLRSRNSKKRGGELHQVDYDALALANLPSPEGHQMIERRMQLLEIDSAIQRNSKREEISGRDRTIFWLHFHFGMTTSAIAQVPTFQLTPKGVESSLRRTLNMLRKSFHRGSP
jgi:RNA polymerase sigma-70 factor (ECF subfamily)